MKQLAIVAAFAWVLSTASFASAAKPCNCPECRAKRMHYEDPEVRAGYPWDVRYLAKPTYTSDYYAGWVGGGTLFHGDGRSLEEGTWGRDYAGRLYNRRVWLDWSHGRRYQGGEGAYKSDGPKIKHE